MFDLNNIIAGCFFGIIGMAGFKYGKSQSSMRKMAIGLLLCIYPYFIENLYALWGVGVALTVALIWWNE